MLSRATVACSYFPATSAIEFTDDLQHVLVMQLFGERGPYDYKKPGLYRLDDPSEPVWSVDWFASDVLPHADGEHMILLGKRAQLNDDNNKPYRLSGENNNLVYQKLVDWNSKQNQNGYFIAFYNSGTLLHEYHLKDLFEDYSKIETPYCGGYGWKLDHVIDNVLNEFKLATTEKTSFTFSITTGEILNVETYDPLEYAKLKQENAQKRLNIRTSKVPEKATQTLLNLIDSNWHITAKIGAPYLSDYALAKRVIDLHGATYRFFDKRLRDRLDLSLLAVTSGESLRIDQLEKHKYNHSILKAGVEHDSRNYSQLPEELKADMKLFKHALSQGGMAVFNEAPENFQNDKAVVIEALRAQLKQFRLDNTLFGFRIEELNAIPARLLDDAEVVRLIDSVIEIHAVSFNFVGIEQYRKQVYAQIRASQES